MRAIEKLPRGWWSIDLPGYREHPSPATYSRFAFDELPSIDRPLDDEFQWLLQEPTVAYSLAHVDEAASRPATSEHLEQLLTGQSITPPRPFVTFIASEAVRARIRSCTDCYLDLADFVVPLSNGGSLIHFLSDSQWVLHWLLYTGTDHSEAGIVTDRAFGFESGDDSHEDTQRIFEARSGQAEVCAESFSEFVYRFWIENEIWFRVNQGSFRDPPLTDEQRRYAEHYVRLRAEGKRQRRT